MRLAARGACEFDGVRRLQDKSLIGRLRRRAAGILLKSLLLAGLLTAIAYYLPWPMPR